MKIIGTLISLILLFTSCENGLKEKVEKEIIAKMNNPKSYEFTKLNLIDSISNHKYYKELVDSLTTKININSYRLLNILFDKKHTNENRKIDSLSEEISFMKRKLVKDKKSNFSNNYKKIKLKENEYKKLQGEYDYKKELKYFRGNDYSMALNEKTIIWDSLIKMDREKLNYYFNESQPFLYERYGIRKNDSIIKTFKFVDSIQKLLKKTKPITKFYIYEFSFREKNNFDAMVLSKRKIKTLENKKEIYKIYE